MEKNKNIRVKKGLLLGDDCTAINDSLYEIKVVNFPMGMEEKSSSSSTNSEIYGANTRGGRNIKSRNKKTKKRKNSKKSRKSRKH
jgi:hypothetical protein